MRWVDQYQVGQVVEVSYPFADGNRWVRGRVKRRNLTDQRPVVRLLDYDFRTIVVARKSEIRATESSNGA